MSNEDVERFDRERAQSPVALSNVVPFPARRRDPAELLDRLKVRDPEAIAAIYRDEHAKVRAFARRMLADPAEAEDVVHDVFVALPDAAKRFRGDSTLSTFLMSIAVNCCRRRTRSAARGRRAVERMHQREVPDAPRSPESETRRRRLAEALERGLARLSVEHREVFVLCAVEERTSTEVAAILEVPAATVRTRLFHARKQLRAFLEAEGAA